jgi:catechol 2,3-dioxygenase-like lactoylglutathione lyase family enzyme
MRPVEPTAQSIGLRLHHIAYATRNTDLAIDSFRALYPRVEVYKAIEASQNVFYTYLFNDWEPHKIELIEPAGEHSPVDTLLSKAETVLYHLSYFVDDFDRGVRFFRRNKFLMVSKPFEPALEPDIRVCHFMSMQGVVVEIMGRFADKG